MKKVFLSFIFLTLVCAAFCQSVGFISSAGEEINSYATTDDFSNTFEINFAPLVQIKPDTKQITFKNSKCQAVRLSKSWFITAAHCVEDVCQNGCNMQTRLIVGRNYEMDIISQSTKTSPQVFIHPNRNAKQNISTYDIALIYFKPLTSKIVYKDTKTQSAITNREFLNRLKNYKSYKRALSSYNTPTLLLIGKYRKQGPILAREFSVLSSFEDKRKVLRSKNKAIYYPQSKTIILENFGIKQGISGSGLMTSKGELAGITSTISDPNDKNQLAQFSALDMTTLDFIEDKIGSIEYTVLK